MGDRRWDRFFAELEAAGEPQVSEEEVEELALAERVSVRLAERMAGSRGRVVQLRTRSGTLRAGRVFLVARTWVVLREPAAAHIVPYGAIIGACGLAAPRPGAVGLPLGWALRRARGAGGFAVVEAGPNLRGRLLESAADHADLRDEAGAVWSVPFAAIEAVRCSPTAFEREC